MRRHAPALESNSTERGTTITGQGARRTISEETLPSSTRRSGPKPRDPITSQIEIALALRFEHPPGVAGHKSRLRVDRLGQAGHHSLGGELTQTPELQLGPDGRVPPLRRTRRPLVRSE
jgi:hypothetical protein